MKQCELCDFPARLYCESDQASLCWDCDVEVHCANFLVARHSRNLLCQVCQSATTWRATGAKLGPTVSVCNKCVSSGNENSRTEQENERENDEETEEDEDESDEFGDMEGEREGDEEEDGENQVVPWSSSPNSFISAPVASSSSEESSSRVCNGEDSQLAIAAVSLKRFRENDDPGSQEHRGCSSSQANRNLTRNEDEASSFGPSRLQKDRKKALILQPPQTMADSKAVVDALKRFQHEKSTDDASATVIDICKLSKDPRLIDVVSTGSEVPPPT